MMKSVSRLALLAAVGLGANAAVGLGANTAAQADTFLLTSCHITGSSCNPGDGGSGFVPDSAAFGTVTLTQSGANVNFDVVLNNGNRFVETGAGGDSLFLFNDSLAGSTVTNITATLNGVVQTTGPGNTFPGGFSGLTNQSPIMADGTGTFTAKVFCTTAADCNGGSIPNINDLHFTVTNALVAQLETANAKGNLFVADILCGATQQFCPGGKTGPVDVPVPGPILGAGLPGLIAACVGLAGLARRRRRKLV